MMVPMDSKSMKSRVYSKMMPQGVSDVNVMSCHFSGSVERRVVDGEEKLVGKINSGIYLPNQPDIEFTDMAKFKAEFFRIVEDKVRSLEGNKKT